MRWIDIAICLAIGIAMGMCLMTGILAICVTRHRERNERKDKERDGKES